MLVARVPPEDRGQDSRGRCEVGRVDSDGEVLALNDIFNQAEPILPAACDSHGIEGRHIQLNAGGGEIDAAPSGPARRPLGLPRAAHSHT